MLTEREPNSGDMAEEPSTPPTKTFCAPLHERREATRFQHDDGTDFAVIFREPGEELLAEVHDESVTGLGILVDAELDLQLGSHINVVYAGEFMQGEVRHITMQSGGKCLVGLHCQRILPEEAE